jgi:GNAT superfamily N-acetyltransferase
VTSGAHAADSITIRPATERDAAAIAQLLDQLGHPAPVSEIPARIAALRDFPGAIAVVALDGFGEVVGLETIHIFPAIHSENPVAWLTALVVLEDVRGAGVGSALVEYAESWAKQNGATRLSLTSALRRTDAHEFYARRNYENSGLRFTKTFIREGGGDA